MQDNLLLLSDHSERTKPSPVNLLDELSVKIKAGVVDCQDLLIAYTDPDGVITLISSPMARYKAVGILTWAANLEMNPNE